MKRKIIMILSIMLLILFSGCSNVTQEICTKLKYSGAEGAEEDVFLENNVCIIEGDYNGNNTLFVSTKYGFTKIDLIYRNTNATCESVDFPKSLDCFMLDKQ